MTVAVLLLPVAGGFAIKGWYTLFDDSYGARIVSGDNMQDEPFWAAYVVSVRLRNKVVHEGKWAEPDEAENSCQATSQLIEHLEMVAGLT